MTKKGDKKEKDAQQTLKKMTDAEKLDFLIKTAEAYLDATSKVPKEITEHYKEIHSMFTAIKDFTNQEFERMSNLETAFTAVMADLQEIKAVLGATPKGAAAPEASGAALVFTSIDALPLRDDIKAKLRMGDPENGKRVIRCEWLGTENWKATNKLLRQMGFKWIKDEQNKKNSRWERE